MERGEPTPTGRRRVSVAEASEALGISVKAVRGRKKRGTVAHERTPEGGYVFIDTDQPPTGYDQPGDQSRPNAAGELVEELRDRVRYLERQVEEEREARRRADTILAQLSRAISRSS